ncbi:hypothetical protein LENED_003638 [Lentinula edodes]|uniref:Uncharacterized protein n=1 Tax=Lentinula edodes TaxID=5353 RepID=A0A1Q3E453_LENED|nr:hypothetical protein LENED_003638 [Lentinula edodes]
MIVPHIQYLQIVFAVPWHQLRHLTLEYSDLDQMHKALCLCTSVVTAGFDSCTNDFSFRDPVAYTCLFLSSLTILASHRLETLGPDITRSHLIGHTSKHLMALIQATSSSLIKLDLCDVDHHAWTPTASLERIWNKVSKLEERFLN